MIYADITMYILGIISNILDIYVFTIWSRSNQQKNQINNVEHTSNSPLYLLTLCANLIVIIFDNIYTLDRGNLSLKIYIYPAF